MLLQNIRPTYAFPNRYDHVKVFSLFRTCTRFAAGCGPIVPLALQGTILYLHDLNRLRKCLSANPGEPWS